MLKCHKCAKNISESDKFCPHCNAKINAFYRLLNTLENKPVYLVLIVILTISLFGIAWFLRIHTGHKWIIYVTIIALAPLVPWVLKIAYGIAAPINSDEKNEGNGDR